MATTAELLSEARAAYHRLQIGEAVAEIRDSNGESVRYTSANASRLLAYIKSLEAQLPGSMVLPVSPFRPVWG